MLYKVSLWEVVGKSNCGKLKTTENFGPQLPTLKTSWQILSNRNKFKKELRIL